MGSKWTGKKTGKILEEKIDAIYLLFLRILVSCVAYDMMMGWETSAPDTCRCHNRHCQTLPTRALVWVITLVSGLAPHCSTAPVSRQILPHLAPNTPTPTLSSISDCCFLINIIGSLFNVFLMRGNMMSMKLKHETSQKIFKIITPDPDFSRIQVPTLFLITLRV